MATSLKSIYIDTCAISHMGDNNFWRLLAASKANKLNIFISEVVIWERLKARHKLDAASFYDTEDKGIPLNVAFFKNTLREFNVNIIEHNDRIKEKATEFIKDEHADFNINDFNELRDAHILAAAFCELDESTIIASDDKEMIRRIPILIPNFSSITKDAIVHFAQTEGIKEPRVNPCNHQSLTEEEIKSPFSSSLLSVLPFIDPESFGKYESDLEKLNIRKIFGEKTESRPEPVTNESGKLDDMLLKLHSVDIEIKKKVLGYTQWFSDPPISKNDLYKLVESDGYGQNEIENNAQRLKQEDLLIETEGYWLTNTKNTEAVEICEQAMAVVMPEILELMGLN